MTPSTTQPRRTRSRGLRPASRRSRASCRSTSSTTSDACCRATRPTWSSSAAPATEQSRIVGPARGGYATQRPFGRYKGQNREGGCLVDTLIRFGFGRCVLGSLLAVMMSACSFESPSDVGYAVGGTVSGMWDGGAVTIRLQTSDTDELI